MKLEAYRSTVNVPGNSMGNRIQLHSKWNHKMTVCIRPYSDNYDKGEILCIRMYCFRIYRSYWEPDWMKPNYLAADASHPYGNTCWKERSFPPLLLLCSSSPSVRQCNRKTNKTLNVAAQKQNIIEHIFAFFT